MLRSSVSQPFTIAAVPNENFPVLGGEGVANRPLKINRDLLLYNGRLELRKSRNTLNSETKKRLLDRCVADRPPAGSRQVPQPQHIGSNPIGSFPPDLFIWLVQQLTLPRDCSAESAFRKVISMDPTDARGYVSLGKLLQEVGRLDEAAQLYEEGCQTLGGSNAYIWQVTPGRTLNRPRSPRTCSGVNHARGRPSHACARRCGDLLLSSSPQAWATLEGKRGNVSQARRLYDAAIVADPKHPAAWHGWGMLEMRQGDLLRARELFIRGLRELGPDRDSAYLHHSLAMLCKRLGRMEEARQWFEQGTFTKEGEGSFALWKDWGQLEAEAGDITLARCGWGPWAT